MFESVIAMREVRWIPAVVNDIADENTRDLRDHHLLYCSI